MDKVLELNEYVLMAALIFTVIALICNIVVITGRSSTVTSASKAKRAPVSANVAGGDSALAASGARPDGSAEAKRKTPRKRGTRPQGLGLYGTWFTIVATVLVLIYLGIRVYLTGYGPFANQHEFAVSFVFGILLCYLVAEYAYGIRALSLIVLPIAAVLTVYAMAQDTSVKPLIPALQNNLLLTLHVGFAIIAYGAACVSCAAAVIYLAYPHIKIKKLPAREVFDDLGYKAATVTFPMLTIMIALGSVWANVAWGRYWDWDPKETAALVTWLIYAGYLHARVTRGWQGKRSARLLLLGFAAVLFAYFGNHFFGGLHSYA